jgi:Fe-S cluster biogenesis protein NfuA
MTQELREQIEFALDTIRPYLEADGGNVRIVELTEDKVLKIEMMGNCGSCPMSTMTLKAGVEEAIMRAIPEITRVEADNLTEA